MIFKRFDDELKRLVDQFIIHRLISTGRYDLYVTGDGKTFYVYDNEEKTTIYKTKKISKAINFLSKKMGARLNL